MNEIIYRSIFPNNNVPKIKIDIPIKNNSFTEELAEAESFLSAYLDISKIEILMKEIEFMHLVENDPVEALLFKLKEVKFTENWNIILKITI